ncbi:MAG: hypothetical protein LBJ64_03150 [Deltaproteobacteria bacterium]|nr:hypothetical protein [Deltaproteobacteria bacterium]
MNPSSTKGYYRSLSPLTSSGAYLAAGGWPGLFPNQAPLELEIGFGNGEYLAKSSESSPDRNFVGLEVAWNSLKRALRRLAVPARDNVRLLHVPAYPALAHYFRPKSLSVVRCLFPVPWPNEKQARKRIFSRAFFKLLANRLTDDGVFFMVTDHEGLARWTMEQAGDSEISLGLTESRELSDTKYERKWLSSGQNIFFHLTGRKNNHPNAEETGVAYMQPRISNLIDPDNYRPQGRNTEPTVVFGDFLYDSRRRQGLLAVKVVEDQFIQEFFIRLSRQPDGAFKLTPALAGQVYPTKGVAAALSLAALEDLNK